METEFTLTALLVFMVFGALVAVETKALISSVISLGVVGIGVSIAFLFLSAPDLAIVQVGVEAVALIFMIRATIGREITPTRGHVAWPGMLAGLVVLLGFLGIGVWGLRGLPPFGTPIISLVGDAPSNRYLAKGLEETGSANIVTAIILDYRGYDTMGEATVLFASILGALVILRGVARKGK